MEPHVAWWAQPHSLLRAWREVIGWEYFFFIPSFSLSLSLCLSLSPSLANIDQPGRRSEGGGLPGAHSGLTRWLRSKEPPCFFPGVYHWRPWTCEGISRSEVYLCECMCVSVHLWVCVSTCPEHLTHVVDIRALACCFFFFFFFNFTLYVMVE